jgi:hypothetical protein
LVESLARGPGDFSTRRNEHTSGVEAKFRGMETAKFGHDFHQSKVVPLFVPLWVFSRTVHAEAKKPIFNQ